MPSTTTRSRTRRPWRRLAPALALVVLAAACGGDDDEDEASGGDGTTASTTADSATDSAVDSAVDSGSTAPPDTGAPTTVSTLPPEDDAGEACGIGLLEEADGPVEVSFWHAMGSDNGTTLEEMTERYNQSQDRVHVT